MQWIHRPNAGFSSAEPESLRRPIVEGEFGPEEVNVADQLRDPDSLLNWMQRVIRRRRETPEFGCGRSRILSTSDDAVFAHRCDWGDRKVMAAHNFAGEPRRVNIEVDSPDLDCELDDLLQEGLESQPLDHGSLTLDLEAYGYRWFRVHSPGEQRI